MEKLSVIILVLFIIAVAVLFLKKYMPDIKKITPDFISGFFNKLSRTETKNNDESNNNGNVTPDIPRTGATVQIADAYINHYSVDNELINTYKLSININEKVCIQRKTAAKVNPRDIFVDCETINADTFYFYRDAKTGIYLAYRRNNESASGIMHENNQFYDPYRSSNGVIKIISPIIISETGNNTKTIVGINGFYCFDGMEFYICNERFVFNVATPTNIKNNTNYTSPAQKKDIRPQ